MKRGATERQTCELNDWGVGTVLRGHETWGSGEGVWTTIVITAIGESELLARGIRTERTNSAGEIFDDHERTDGEHLFTLRHREWTKPAPDPATRDSAGERGLG